MFLFFPWVQREGKCLCSTPLWIFEWIREVRSTNEKWVSFRAFSQVAVKKEGFIEAHSLSYVKKNRGLGATCWGTCVRFQRPMNVCHMNWLKAKSEGISGQFCPLKISGGILALGCGIWFQVDGKQIWEAKHLFWWFDLIPSHRWRCSYCSKTISYNTNVI